MSTSRLKKTPHAPHTDDETGEDVHHDVNFEDETDCGNCFNF